MDVADANFLKNWRDLQSQSKYGTTTVGGNNNQDNMSTNKANNKLCNSFQEELVNVLSFLWGQGHLIGAMVGCHGVGKTNAYVETINPSSFDKASGTSPA